MGFWQDVVSFAAPVVGGIFGGPVGAAIGGAVGGIIGGQEEEHQFNQQQQLQHHIAAENIKLQKEFAQHGIRWRVEDAKAAGLHPLYALGANTTSFSPVSVGAVQPPDSYNMARMGQDLSRAIHSTRTRDERTELFADLQLQNAKLQNDLLASQIAKLNQSQVGPASPAMLPSNSGLSGGLIGQGDAPAYVKEVPSVRTHSQPNRPAQEAGIINDYGYVRTPTGISIIPSKDVKERIEDQMIPELAWAWRNQVVPALKGLPAPDPKYYPLPKGYNRWKWDTLNQEFRPWSDTPWHPKFLSR